MNNLKGYFRTLGTGWDFQGKVPTYPTYCDTKAQMALALRLQPKRILEIGTGYGEFLSCVLPLAPMAFAVTLDVKQVGKIGQGWRESTLEKRITQLFLEDFPSVEEARAEIIRQGPYDLVLIDGGHSLEDVVSDSLFVLNSNGPVEPGASVLWHDFHPTRTRPPNLKNIRMAIVMLANMIEGGVWIKDSWYLWAKVSKDFTAIDPAPNLKSLAWVL